MRNECIGGDEVGESLTIETYQNDKSAQEAAEQMD